MKLQKIYFYRRRIKYQYIQLLYTVFSTGLKFSLLYFISPHTGTTSGFCFSYILLLLYFNLILITFCHFWILKKKFILFVFIIKISLNQAFYQTHNTTFQNCLFSLFLLFYDFNDLKFLHY